MVLAVLGKPAVLVLVVSIIVMIVAIGMRDCIGDMGRIVQGVGGFPVVKIVRGVSILRHPLSF